MTMTRFALAILLLVVLFLPAILSFFPRTKVLVDKAGGYLAMPLRDVGQALLDYLPNLG